MIGERVRLVREACGFTQQELASLAGVSQRVISEIESMQAVSPSASSVAAIAEASGYPIEFFYLGPLPDLPEGHYRRLARGTVKIEKQVRAHTRHLVELVQLAEKKQIIKLPDVTLEPISDLVDVEKIESIVIDVRDSLGVGERDPIRNVIRAVERAGVIVVRLPGQMIDHDSFSAWPDRDLGGRPIIVLTGGHPGDRDRFNVGHELGHIIFHSVRRNTDPKQAEIEAHRFAGALLLPRKAAREVLQHPITLRVLMNAKAGYGISIAAAARRALDLSLISPIHYRSLRKQISARGWSKEEPVEVAQEQPTLISDVMRVMGGSDLLTLSERAQCAYLPVFTYSAFLLEAKKAA